MGEKPVIILGAGATKACGGPLTEDILPMALNSGREDYEEMHQVEDREQLLQLTEEFLGDCFKVPVNRESVTKEDCPSLSMVLSMLHRSIELGQNIGAWEGERLIRAKRAIEYSIFAVIEAALRRIPECRQFHRDLLRPLYEKNIQPAVVSLNYDVIVDNAMFSLSEYHQNMHPPDYCTKIATDRYVGFCSDGVFGRLLKIHGSLNWLYCERCQRLDLFISRGMRTAKALDVYYSSDFEDSYSCRGTRCHNTDCDGFISPILITPTYVKDYENPHIDRVWEEAKRSMEEADRAAIIGYSLPTDDVEVAMLFKQGLDHLSPDRITVVEYVQGDIDKAPDERTQLGQHPTGRRFRSLFGEGLDWHTTGFGGWLKEQRDATQFPFA